MFREVPVFPIRALTHRTGSKQGLGDRVSCRAPRRVSHSAPLSSKPDKYTPLRGGEAGDVATLRTCGDKSINISNFMAKPAIH